MKRALLIVEDEAFSTRALLGEVMGGTFLVQVAKQDGSIAAQDLLVGVALGSAGPKAEKRTAAFIRERNDWRNSRRARGRKS